MSRREARDSDSRHHRSRFDREPSPKRPRRDGKPATERPASNLNLDSGHSDKDQKHRRRLQNALPLEAASPADPKADTGALNKESDKKTNGHREGTKRSSDSTEAPRSRSFSQQHDERGNSGQAGRSFTHKETADRGWWRDSRDRHSERGTNRTTTDDSRQRDERDSRDQHSERGTNRTTTDDSRQRDEKSHVRAEDNRTLLHDGYFKMEADPKPPARKRPSFREKKVLPVDTAEVVDKEATTEPTKPSHNDIPIIESEKREERRKPASDRPEKQLAGEREANQRDFRRGNFSSRDRYSGSGGGGGSYKGRERFNGRLGQRRQNGEPVDKWSQNGEPVDKWKHDLFDEANRSPTPKNEEDQIAKVEALLASW